MGKRAAETELNQDNWEHEHPGEQESEGDGSFMQASNAKLAKRQIKGLPKRKGTTAASISSPSATPQSTAVGSSPCSKFTAELSSLFQPGALSGFSLATHGPNSTLEPLKHTLMQQRGINVAALNTLTQAITKDPFADLSLLLSSLSKQYADKRKSIPTPAATIKSVAPAATPAAPKPVTSQTSDAPKPSPFAGFSFAAPVSTTAKETPAASTLPPAKPVEAPTKSTNPFANISFGTPAAAIPTKPEKTVAESKPPQEDDSKQQPKPSTKPPAVPEGAFTFAGKPVTQSAPSSSTPPPPGSFVFDPSKATDSSSSPFSFPKSTTTPPSDVSSQNGHSNTDEPGLKTSTFNFGAAPSKPSPLRFGSNIDSPPPSKFGSRVQSTEAAASSKDDAPSPPTSKPSFGSSTKTSAFNFGSTNGSSSSSASTAGASPFSFAAPKPSTTDAKPAAFSFSAPSAADGKPAFSFGSASPLTSTSTPEKKTATPAFSFGGGSGNSPPSVGFAFGQGSGAFGAPKATPTTAEGTTESAESSAAETPAADEGTEPANGLLGEGEGEEGEQVLGNELRAKLFVLENGAWKDRGIGQFKVKKNTVTGKCRLLGRNASNGKVIQNFLLFKELADSLKVEAAGKNATLALSFTEEGKLVPGKLKGKTKEVLQDFEKVLRENCPE